MKRENKKLAELLKQFRPVFGKERHIQIRDWMGKLHTKRKLLAARETKAKELQKEIRDTKEARTEIDRIEETLIWLLEQEISPKQ